MTSNHQRPQQKINYKNLIELIGPSGASKMAAEKIVLFAKNQAK
jgi:hypothetical protein